MMIAAGDQVAIAAGHFITASDLYAVPSAGPQFGSVH